MSVVTMFLVAMSMFSSLSSSLLNSLSGSSDFSLGDVAVSVVSPHSVWSQVASGTIDPGLVRDIGHRSALIVAGDFHSTTVLLVLDGCEFSVEETLLFHGVQDPSRADIDDIIDLLVALLLTVDHRASLELLDLSNTTSWVRFVGELDRGEAAWSVFVDLPSGGRSLHVLQWVVVGWEHSGEDDAIWIRVWHVESVTPTETEGHTVLRWDLLDGEGVHAGVAASEGGQEGVEEVLFNIDVWVVGSDDIGTQTVSHS